MKLKLSKYFLYFMMYAIIGWCYEVFLEVVVYRWGFSNRGELFGPYCPVYGLGAIAFILGVYPIIKKQESFKKKIFLIPIVFLLCMLIATSLELFTSYICEWTSGGWKWDYSRYPFNFQGRIALNPSVRFGIGGVAFLYLLQPLFEKITKKLGDKKVKIVSLILFTIIIVDCIYTFIIK